MPPLAAIPYFALKVTTIDLPGLPEIPIDPWATLVCVGFVVGMEVARNRAIKMGLAVRDIVDGAVFIVLMGFLMGHVVYVVGYHPEQLQEQGIMSLLRFWAGFSSFGGFLGAVLGTFLFYGLVRRRRPFWRYADLIAYGLPFGWIFGRLACGVVHDHVGSKTTFPLAMDFDNPMFGTGDPAPWADGVRHELGLYEAAFMVAVSTLFWALGKKDRPPGYFVGMFGVVYAPVRFLLDFLRNTDLKYQDVRYFGLTPAQYGAIIMFCLAAWLLASRDYKGFTPLPMDGGKVLDSPAPEPKAGEDSAA